MNDTDRLVESYIRYIAFPMHDLVHRDYALEEHLKQMQIRFHGEDEKLSFLISELSKTNIREKRTRDDLLDIIARNPKCPEETLKAFSDARYFEETTFSHHELNFYRGAERFGLHSVGCPDPFLEMSVVLEKDRKFWIPPRIGAEGRSSEAFFFNCRQFSTTTERAVILTDNPVLAVKNQTNISHRFANRIAWLTWYSGTLDRIPPLNWAVLANYSDVYYLLYKHSGVDQCSAIDKAINAGEAMRKAGLKPCKFASLLLSHTADSYPPGEKRRVPVILKLEDLHSLRNHQARLLNGASSRRKTIIEPILTPCINSGSLTLIHGIGAGPVLWGVSMALSATTRSKLVEGWKAKAAIRDVIYVTVEGNETKVENRFRKLLRVLAAKWKPSKEPERSKLQTLKTAVENKTIDTATAIEGFAQLRQKEEDTMQSGRRGFNWLNLFPDSVSNLITKILECADGHSSWDHEVNKLIFIEAQYDFSDGLSMKFYRQLTQELYSRGWTAVLIDANSSNLPIEKMKEVANELDVDNVILAQNSKPGKLKVRVTKTSVKAVPSPKSFECEYDLDRGSPYLRKVKRSRGKNFSEEQKESMRQVLLQAGPRKEEELRQLLEKQISMPVSLSTVKALKRELNLTTPRTKPFTF